MQNAIGQSGGQLTMGSNRNHGQDCDKQHSKDVIEYSNQVEDIIAWLFCKEEELQKRTHEFPLQGATLDTLLDEYSLHEKFMAELCEYCHVIMKCKETGQEMRDNDSQFSEEDRDEIGIQMDAMMVCYEKLKILTTDRLHDLQQIIEDQQRSKIQRLEEWLSTIEFKIASLTNIGPDFDAIQRQINDVDEFKNELRQKQDFLNFISKVIIFDEVDVESAQSKNCIGSINLETRLENMNKRWTKICSFVDERNDKLRKAESIWHLLQQKEPQLIAWLKTMAESLHEVSNAAQDMTDIQDNKSFISKLIAKSDKIEKEIREKQLFYSSLEGQVRSEIEKFDDPCSMLVIELEKKLENLQDSWNAIMRQKRMLDYKLRPFLNTDTEINPNNIETNLLQNNYSNQFRLKNQSTDDSQRSNHIQKPDSSQDLDRNLSETQDYLSQGYNSRVTSNWSGEREPSLALTDSPSDHKTFDNSLSSGTRSILYGSNEHGQQSLIHDNGSHEEISYTTNLNSSQHEQGHSLETGDSSNYSRPITIQNDESYSQLSEKMSGIDDAILALEFQVNETHNCRAEEWRHSLESFSNWLKQVEVSLGMECPFDIASVVRGKQLAWSQLDLLSQLNLMYDIEKRVEQTCQDEFDCLLLQGQQIIEDLKPEIDEVYEANLKEILSDIEIRYGAVKRCIYEHKQEVADKERWRRLSRKLLDSCNYIKQQMNEAVPESSIGIDLINLAQQQDQLLHLKDDLENNMMVHSSLQEAKNFLKLYEILQKYYGQSYEDLRKSNVRIGSLEIWLSVKEFKENIEEQFDRLSLHYSELSQVIEDRLSRLDEVHKEMHALQHRIQDMATELQLAEILKSNWIPLDNLSIEQLSGQLEDLKSYRERLCEVESAHKSMTSIFDWMTDSGVPLSQSNLKRIEELISVWELIQEAVEVRQKLIEHAFDEQSGSEQKFLVQTVADLPSWQRKVATSKVPYFINHDSNKTLWDHPKFTDLLNIMNNSTKQYVFSVYRTAMKLRIIQKKFSLDMLMLEQLKEAFDSLDIAANNKQVADNAENQSIQTSSLSNDSLVGVEQIIILLKAIYERIQAEELPSLDVPVAIDLTLNWLLNLYDPSRTGYISALSLKVGLALLCCATREEKYVHMFELFASPTTRTVDARKLSKLIESCVRVPIYLGESESFGEPELIEKSIRNCLLNSKYNPSHPNSIDLNDYLNWLKTEPQFIIWLPVLHRLLISENTIHRVNCKLCGLKKIIGLRYRCLKCFKFNICQNCFLSGRHIREHEDPEKHPMQEYCNKTTSGENVRDLTKILRNKLNPRT